MKSHGPLFISLGSDKNNSNLPPADDMSCKNTMDPQIYGMIATVLNGIIHMCGGGQHFYNNAIQGFFSTSRCQRFNVQQYNWENVDISLKEDRTFAQSIMFANNTWFIMGGRNSRGIVLETTEYLDANATEFVYNINMPMRFAQHCAKMISHSELFTTGGYSYLGSSSSRG